MRTEDNDFVMRRVESGYIITCQGVLIELFMSLEIEMSPKRQWYLSLFNAFQMTWDQKYILGSAVACYLFSHSSMGPYGAHHASVNRVNTPKETMIPQIWAGSNLICKLVLGTAWNFKGGFGKLILRIDSQHLR